MEALKEILYKLGLFCAGLVRTAIEWFMDLSLLNKVIVINTLISFLAITLPIAKYYIFESWTGINNPVAVYLILIVIIMFATIFFHGPMVLALRVIANLWYLVAIIVISAAHAISHAPYVLSIGFFFNLIAPVIYIAASVLIFLEGDY